MLRERAASYPLPPHGHHPNFVGAKEAAAALLAHPQVAAHRCLIVGADRALYPLRRLALAAGVVLYLPDQKRDGWYFRVNDVAGNGNLSIWERRATGREHERGQRRDEHGDFAARRPRRWWRYGISRAGLFTRHIVVARENAHAGQSGIGQKIPERGEPGWIGLRFEVSANGGDQSRECGFPGGFHLSER